MPELAEGARLEIVCSANPGTVGSNPTLSAILFVLNIIHQANFKLISLPPLQEGEGDQLP
jgi:hypothetical protein